MRSVYFVGHPSCSVLDTVLVKLFFDLDCDCILGRFRSFFQSGSGVLVGGSDVLVYFGPFGFVDGFCGRFPGAVRVCVQPFDSWQKVS